MRAPGGAGDALLPPRDRGRISSPTWPTPLGAAGARVGSPGASPRFRDALASAPGLHRVAGFPPDLGGDAAQAGRAVRIGRAGARDVREGVPRRPGRDGREPVRALVAECPRGGVIPVASRQALAAPPSRLYGHVTK